MCGITGFFTEKPILSRDHLAKMTDALQHRGPDASGLYLNGRVGLGHRRLSIIDLSEKANQPMISRDGRYQIIYNGEVYNYREIAKELKHSLQTTCDTEVVLESFAQWGDDFVNKLNGMFAFAIHDSKNQELILYRDRMGIKPLFYYWDGQNFAFASEIKALLTLDLIRDNTNIEKKALNAYLHLGYIPEPLTIYTNIFKFPAGNYLKVGTDKFEFKTYWRLVENIQPTSLNDFRAAKSQLDELVTSSVRYRLISDVPFGTFLSGGTDSSLVTAIAQKISPEPIKTFSIGFKESKFNEAEHAKKVASHLGTEHHEFILSHQDAIPLFEDILDVYDEPFADSSAIPTMLVSKMARQHVKMTLSGDGGDETYMGYGFYKWAQRLNNPIVKLLRKPIGNILSQLPSSRLQRAAHLFFYENVQTIKSHIFSQEQYYFTRSEINEMLLPAFKNDLNLDENFDRLPRKLSPAEAQALFDLKYYLKDDLLVKVDRASMRYSLETRVPLLDHRLVNFALNLNESLKVKGPVYKYLLKELLYDYVPKQFFDRPKWGFGIPLNIWLKGELSHLQNDYLNESVLKEAGIVDPSRVQELVSGFNQGKNYLYNRLWNLIILHKWYFKSYKN